MSPRQSNRTPELTPRPDHSGLTNSLNSDFSEACLYPFWCTWLPLVNLVLGVLMYLRNLAQLNIYYGQHDVMLRVISGLGSVVTLVSTQGVLGIHSGVGRI